MQALVRAERGAERNGAIHHRCDRDDVSYSRRHRRRRSPYARAWTRERDDEPAVAYARHYAPRDATRRDATASQVSREGIRPISINGQGDTCCLIVTDGYAQLTVLGHRLSLAARVPLLRKGAGREANCVRAAVQKRTNRDENKYVESTAGTHWSSQKSGGETASRYPRQKLRDHHRNLSPPIDTSRDSR